MRLTLQELQEITGSDQPEHLAELSLGNKHIDDLGCLSKCTQLTELNLGFNELTSLAALAPCVALQSLNVMHNKLRSLAGLEGLVQLRCLKAGSNRLSELGALVDHGQLEELWLQSNRLQSLAGVVGSLCKLPALEKVVLAQNGCLLLDPKADRGQPACLPARYHLLASLTKVSFIDGMVEDEERAAATRNLQTEKGKAALAELLEAQAAAQADRAGKSGDAFRIGQPQRTGSASGGGRQGSGQGQRRGNHGGGKPARKRRPTEARGNAPRRSPRAEVATLVEAQQAQAAVASASVVGGEDEEVDPVLANARRLLSGMGDVGGSDAAAGVAEVPAVPAAAAAAADPVLDAARAALAESDGVGGGAVVLSAAAEAEAADPNLANVRRMLAAMGAGGGPSAPPSPSPPAAPSPQRSPHRAAAAEAGSDGGEEIDPVLANARRMLAAMGAGGDAVGIDSGGGGEQPGALSAIQMVAACIPDDPLAGTAFAKPKRQRHPRHNNSNTKGKGKEKRPSSTGNRPRSGRVGGGGGRDSRQKRHSEPGAGPHNMDYQPKRWP